MYVLQSSTLIKRTIVDPKKKNNINFEKEKLQPWLRLDFFGLLLGFLLIHIGWSSALVPFLGPLAECPEPCPFSLVWALLFSFSFPFFSMVLVFHV